MMTELRPLTKLTSEGIRVLYREMGVVNAVRFLTQFVDGYGDYTQERQTQIASQSMDVLVEQLNQLNISTQAALKTS